MSKAADCLANAFLLSGRLMIRWMGAHSGRITSHMKLPASAVTMYLHQVEQVSKLVKLRVQVPLRHRQPCSDQTVAELTV